MNRPSIRILCFSCALAWGLSPGALLGRDAAAESAIKAAEARLRASTAVNRGGGSAPVLVDAGKGAASPGGNLFSRIADRLSRSAGGGSGTEPEVRPVPSPSKPAPSVRMTSRGHAPKPMPRAVAKRPDGADLGQLFSGILQRLGPMDMERTDDSVLSPPPDSLALLAHPNIQPMVPVVPQPVPFAPRRPEVSLPDPLREPRTSWLISKVAEKLERMEAAQLPVSAPPVMPVERVAEPSVPSREEIESMALLAVVGKGRVDRSRPEPVPVPVAMERGETESRLSALSLLAGTDQSGAGARKTPGLPGVRKELPGLPEVLLEPIPPLPPARQIEPERSGVLVLLQPDSFAGAP